MKTPAPGEEPEREGEKSAGRHDNFAHSASSGPSATFFRYGARARLFVRPDMEPLGHALAIARDPASVDRVHRPGDSVTVLTFPLGVSWPDRAGLAVAATTLETDGLVVLLFGRLNDALACQRRLRGGGA